jgi:hypothetical protein
MALFLKCNGTGCRTGTLLLSTKEAERHAEGA